MGYLNSERGKIKREFPEKQKRKKLRQLKMGSLLQTPHVTGRERS